MKPDFFCLDCNQPVMLDRHGYCTVCGSNAVDILERGSMPDRVPTFEEAAVECLKEMLGDKG